MPLQQHDRGPEPGLQWTAVPRAPLTAVVSPGGWAAGQGVCPPHHQRATSRPRAGASCGTSVQRDRGEPVFPAPGQLQIPLAWFSFAVCEQTLSQQKP